SLGPRRFCLTYTFLRKFLGMILPPNCGWRLAVFSGKLPLKGKNRLQVGVYSLGLCVSTIQNEKQLSSHRKYDEEIIGASEAHLSRLRRSHGIHCGRFRFGGWPRALECPNQQIADYCGES